MTLSSYFIYLHGEACKLQAEKERRNKYDYRGIYFSHHQVKNCLYFTNIGIPEEKVDEVVVQQKYKLLPKHPLQNHIA